MGTFLQDLRYGARMLVKSPGATAIALITLALGIGVNTATYSVIRTESSTPYQFADANRLAFLFSPTDEDDEAGVNALDYLDWCDEARSFTDIALLDQSMFFLSDTGEPERINGLRATANLMPMLGMVPQLGRLYAPDEDAPGAEGVILLADKLWDRKFDRRPDVLGRVVQLNDRSYTIIGVLPPEFELQNSRMWYHVEFLVPLRLDRAELEREYRWNRCIAHLKPEVTFEQAQAEMTGIAARLAEAYPETNQNVSVTVASLTKRFDSMDNRLAMLGLLVAVGMVLLIACANLANLLLAKASSRVREFAIRTALGAGRIRIVRQLLTESLLLAALGGVLGLLVGLWVIDAIKASVDLIPGQTQNIRLNSAVLMYTLAASVAAALIFGLAPALMTSRVSTIESLKEGATASSAGRSRNRLQNGLVVAQLAIALPLFVCCGLTIRHLIAMRTVDFGFDADRLVTMEVDLPSYRYNKLERWAPFYHDAIEAIEAMPGIERAGATLSLPVFGMSFHFAPIKVEGHPVDAVSPQDVRWYQSVTPGYFETMGIPLIRGRFFLQSDHPDTQKVAIVSERMAGYYWPNEDPIGRRVTIDENGTDSSETAWITVVGVVADAGRELRGGPPRPMLFLPALQKPTNSMTIVARTRGDPKDAIPAMRAAIHNIDPGIPVCEGRTVADIVHSWCREDRTAAWFLGTMAALALGLAGIGLYGVMSCVVVQRTHEIGVRMALGASKSEVLRLVIRRCLILAALGIAFGLALSIPVGLSIESALFDVSGIDPLAYVGVSVLLLAVAAMAGYVPARRATKVDPIVALRCE